MTLFSWNCLRESVAKEMNGRAESNFETSSSSPSFPSLPRSRTTHPLSIMSTEAELSVYSHRLPILSVRGADPRFLTCSVSFRKALKVVDLKALLSTAGLPVSGKKDDLIHRLLDNQKTLAAAEEETPVVEEEAAVVAEEVVEGGGEEEERGAQNDRASKRQKLDEPGTMVVDGEEEPAAPVPAPAPSAPNEATPPPPPSAPEPIISIDDSIPPPPPPPPVQQDELPPPPTEQPSFEDAPLPPPAQEEEVVAVVPEEPVVEEESSDEEEEEVYVEDVNDQKARTDLYLDTVSHIIFSTVRDRL